MVTVFSVPGKHNIRGLSRRSTYYITEISPTLIFNNKETNLFHGLHYRDGFPCAGRTKHDVGGRPRRSAYYMLYGYALLLVPGYITAEESAGIYWIYWYFWTLLTWISANCSSEFGISFIAYCIIFVLPHLNVEQLWCNGIRTEITSKQYIDLHLTKPLIKSQSSSSMLLFTHSPSHFQLANI